MRPGFHWEPVIATGYAMLLVVIAGALEWMARHASKRAGRYRTQGFRFQKRLDHWECPTGTQLLRAEIDNDLRVIRYRAPAHICNGCPVKTNCTDSHNGREIEVPLDPWLTTEIGRFHRGMSLALLVLAGAINAFELFWNDHGPEGWVLVGGLTLITLLIVNGARSFRGHPGVHGDKGIASPSPDVTR